MEQADRYADVVPSDLMVNVNEKSPITVLPAPVSLSKDETESKRIDQQQLINKLNYLNFINKSLFVNFRHKQNYRPVSIKAKPQPCQDNRLVCVWQQDAVGIVTHAEYFSFQNILIPDGKRLMVAEPEVVEFDAQEIHFRLPEICYASDARSTRRHRSQGVSVFINQNGALYYGSLIDFSAFSLRVQVQTAPPQSFDWVDTELAVNTILFDGNQTLYSGECKVVKNNHGQKAQEWVVVPLNRNIRRFRAKTFRSTRQQMRPQPTIRFVHPLSKKGVHLEVLNLSGSGLAVREETRHAVLLPGLIIPDLQICFGDGGHVSCLGQVVYSRTVEKEGPAEMLQCGIAILDMPADDHIKVLGLIQQTNDKNAFLCHRVDLDELWDFFFETGFIYPQKYEYIEKNKDRIKETYKKLYTESPEIARHFIHQRHGQILAHMATVRFYEKAWLIHHHAALRVSNNRGGLAVLNQIGSFINNSHRLNAIKMSYVFCYYRPDNKFPNHVFGGAARTIQCLKGCSVDRFAYFHFSKPPHGDETLPAGWSLEAITENDLRDLECFYEDQSGGLMIQAFSLSADNHDMAETEAAFAKIGLVRSRHLHSLKLRGVLRAVFILNIADIGLNMSDLTNSAKIVILKQEGLNFPILQAAMVGLFNRYGLDQMPVLAYPAPIAEALGVPCEKIYNLWILSMNFTDEYFKYLKRLLKFIKH